ncbi:thermonuclease family protein [Rhizobium sp. NTR19]|uniref:Thermonuclease family protein n=1 Tax=Neorhizobium turbinariae TaxID=2937795 RepID=A0ABT0IML3_9HYPH|nr:thermonuclease family protein [Neorhizobium turbinariae]MCK8779107.1 thermonuclease family protein [Neorhizobium turbinariae]
MLSTLFVCASLLVVDGDTIKCDGQNMRLLGGGTPFVSGIDTPEIGSHAKCEKERKLALLAKQRLRSLIEGKAIKVEANGVDQFKRPLVNLYLPDGQEVGQILLREGTAREWRPGKKNDWCQVDT